MIATSEKKTRLTSENLLQDKSMRLEIQTTTESNPVVRFELTVEIDEEGDYIRRIQALRSGLANSNMYPDDKASLCEQIDRYLETASPQKAFSRRRDLALARLRTLSRDKQEQVFYLIEQLESLLEDERLGLTPDEPV